LFCFVLFFVLFLFLFYVVFVAHINSQFALGALCFAFRVMHDDDAQCWCWMLDAKHGTLLHRDHGLKLLHGRGAAGIATATTAAALAVASPLAGWR
jgi:hypothetical protein